VAELLRYRSAGRLRILLQIRETLFEELSPEFYNLTALDSTSAENSSQKCFIFYVHSSELLTASTATEPQVVGGYLSFHLFCLYLFLKQQIHFFNSSLPFNTWTDFDFLLKKIQEIS
jgi:hypothetical protein